MAQPNLSFLGSLHGCSCETFFSFLLIVVYWEIPTELLKYIFCSPSNINQAMGKQNKNGHMFHELRKRGYKASRTEINRKAQMKSL